MDVGKSALRKIYRTRYEKTAIQDNAYIGANAVILNGVRIGENCLVCAGSVVLNSFPSNALIGGVPARLKRKSVVDKETT
jgi:2,3,4,5-tetrahydropyridine-2-carboxylate N-succinyltransferase/tetrahydrodipicolinate N-acetyltransferase